MCQVVSVYTCIIERNMGTCFNNILLNCLHRRNKWHQYIENHGRNVLVANGKEIVEIKREIISDAISPFEYKINT